MACLKREMGERFQVWIAKLDGEIIGFHCGMTDGREVEAFFVGFEGRHNKSYALYQRMLVEFIQWGLALGCTSVNLGRTALDIKASLGAEPQRLVLHERMANPIMHAPSRCRGKRPEATCPQARSGSRNQSIMKSSPPPRRCRGFLSLGDHVLPASQTCIAGSGRGYATRAASTRPAQRSRFPWCRTTDGVLEHVLGLQGDLPFVAWQVSAHRQIQSGEAVEAPLGVTAPRRKLPAWHFQASPNVQEAKKRLDQLKPALLKGESNPDPSLTTR